MFGNCAPSVLATSMVAMLCHFRGPVELEDLVDVSRLPSVDALRPCRCPLCNHPARPPGKALGIVGHGTYVRQVLKMDAKTLLIHVRRYLCRGCRRTISVLMETLLPRRWYAGPVILLALTLSLLQGVPAAKVRRQLAEPGETQGWKTLDRWQRQLLSPLWSWFAAQLGFAERGPGVDRAERSDRLQKLLLLHGATGRCRNDEIERVACELARGTAHAGSQSWVIGRGP